MTFLAPASNPALTLSSPAAIDILVVEDQAEFRELLEEFLASVGYEVKVAATGRAALAFLNGRRARLLVTDIFMPETDGFELLTRLRRSHPDLPIIAMSGSAFEDLEVFLQTARHLGAGRTLAKPFDLMDLLAAVQAMIGEPR